MSAPSTFAALARALHHRRHREALALIDALLAQMPDSARLRQQRAWCTEALAEEEAATVQPPELVRVDAALFSFDQQRDCNAPAADLRLLGFLPVLDAASPSFSRKGVAPILIRFFGDEAGDNLIVRFSAVLAQRSAHLLACASRFSDGHVLFTQREGDWPIAAGPAVSVHRLPQRTSLVELVTRHAGLCATHLRNDASLSRQALHHLADCDRIWRALAPT